MPAIVKCTFTSAQSMKQRRGWPRWSGPSANRVAHGGVKFCPWRNYDMEVEKKNAMTTEQFRENIGSITEALRQSRSPICARGFWILRLKGSFFKINLRIILEKYKLNWTNINISEIADSSVNSLIWELKIRTTFDIYIRTQVGNDYSRRMETTGTTTFLSLIFIFWK